MRPRGVRRSVTGSTTTWSSPSVGGAHNPRRSFALRVVPLSVGQAEGKMGPMTDSEVVARRVRNRVIDYLELVASLDEQRRYQAAVPLVHVPSELINQWEDWVRGSSEQLPDAFPSTVYSPAEVAAVASFHAVWDSVAARTPNPMPPLAELHQLPVWGEMTSAAQEALGVFRIRGRTLE